MFSVLKKPIKRRFKDTRAEEYALTAPDRVKEAAKALVSPQENAPIPHRGKYVIIQSGLLLISMLKLRMMKAIPVLISKCPPPHPPSNDPIDSLTISRMRSRSGALTAIARK